MPFGRRSREPRNFLVDPEDLIPDRRLRATAEDRLEHDAIARSIAEIAIMAEAPTNIALFGPWGSGKSSVYSMIEAHLAELQADAVVVRYDAWKYGGQALKRNFIESISLDLGVADADEDDGLHQNTETVELRLGAWLKANWWSLTLGVFVALGVATISLGLLAWASVVLTHVPLVESIKSSIGPAGTVLGLALAAMLVGPKVLEGAVRKRTVAPPSLDDQFSKRFGTTVAKVLKKHKASRIIIFIDELDRCSPGDVVSTLVDLKTFLDQPNCVFVVAADREVIESSLHEVPQAKPVRDDEPYYATPGAFLDKIFQYQVSLPPLRPRALTRYARTLVENQGGVWREMRNAGGDLFDDVVFALIPVHVRSPRRVKVLINNFAANARISQARGVPWLARAREISILTVLETEFPNVAADMIQYPRLLQSLRTREIPSAPAAAQMMSRYLIDDGEGAPATRDEQSPAGDLLADEGESTEMATKRLNEQLLLYVEKVSAAGIQDPRPDLFYLQRAGHTDGVLDSKPADAIDFVSDTAPDVVLKLFEGQPSEVLVVAVPLIVAEGEQDVGPGRRLAFETACRLVELMDPAGIEAIAREVAPPIFATAADSSWRVEATPGAVRLAFAARNGRSLEPLLTLVAANDPSGAILGRVADALPYALDDESAELVHAALGESFRYRSGPVLHALATLPIDAAISAWDALAPYVLEALDEMDAEADASAATSTPTAVVGGVPVTPDPPPPSAALESLNELINTVAERADSAELLASVYGKLQTINADRLQDSLRNIAPSVLQKVSDPRAVNQIVLRGIERSETASWPEWSPLFVAMLESEQGGGSFFAPSANEVLVHNLLAAFAAETDATVISSFPELVKSVATLSASDGAAEVGEAFHDMFLKLDWQELGEKFQDDATFDVLWNKVNAAHEASTHLRGLLGDEIVDTTLASDIDKAIRTISLEIDTNQARLLALIESSTLASARHLLELNADFLPAEAERLQVLQLRLWSRRQCGGEPLPSSELGALDTRPISLDILSGWLELDPPVMSAIERIADVIRVRQSLEQYSLRLGSPERTSLWSAAEAASASDLVLQAIGRHGVDAPAIDYMRSQLDQLTRQQDRDRLVQRTMQCAVKKGFGTEAARKAVSLSTVT